MNKNRPIIIIGAGMVGLAIALELLSAGYTKIKILERNKDILGLNQSTTNEGTIHSGVYYPKNIMPLKASLCVEGNRLMYDFLEEHDLPYKKTGKLIIATNKKEDSYLDYFLKVGIDNKVPGIKKITSSEACKKEPNLGKLISALYVPSAGIASPIALIRKIKKLAEEKDAEFIFGTKVKSISYLEKSGSFTVNSEDGREFQADFVINSAGLYSDEVARMINPASKYTIEPARGEFAVFDKSSRTGLWMNGMHVYQPPYFYSTENGKMKKEVLRADEIDVRLEKGDLFITAGMHLSPSFDEAGAEFILGNTVTVSPLKTLGTGKEDYSTGLHSPSDFARSVEYFFPNIRESDLRLDHAGIMCTLLGERDFVIERDRKLPNFINLIGMESPAWTSCFAIAKLCLKLVEKKKF